MRAVGGLPSQRPNNEEKFSFYDVIMERIVLSLKRSAISMKALGQVHYDDVIMGAIASQITSLTVVYSTVYSDVDQRKHQRSASLAFVGGNSPGTGKFPAQMASNAENVSIWWRHHVEWICVGNGINTMQYSLKLNCLESRNEVSNSQIHFTNLLRLF